MSIPFSTSSTTGLILAAVFGFIFGILLNKGRVTDYNVIVNFFRLKDLTVMKIMLTAIIVGGIGVYTMMQIGWLESYHLKDANILAVVIGSALFGIGMALYGFCPGTAIAAIATARLDAIVGVLGMLVGGIAYAFAYPWIKTNIISVAQWGKISLPELTGIPTLVFWIILPIIAIFLFRIIERKTN